MTQISTPVKGFNGIVAGVSFANGVGETDDEAAIAYFTRHGYVVDEAKDVDLSKARKDDLIAYAAEHGIEVDEKATKAEILAVITAAPADDTKTDEGAPPPPPATE